MILRGHLPHESRIVVIWTLEALESYAASAPSQHLVGTRAGINPLSARTGVVLKSPTSNVRRALGTHRSRGERRRRRLGSRAERTHLPATSASLSLAEIGPYRHRDPALQAFQHRSWTYRVATVLCSGMDSLRPSGDWENDAPGHGLSSVELLCAGQTSAVATSGPCAQEHDTGQRARRPRCKSTSPSRAAGRDVQCTEASTAQARCGNAPARATTAARALFARGPVSIKGARWKCRDPCVR